MRPLGNTARPSLSQRANGENAVLSAKRKALRISRGPCDFSTSRCAVCTHTCGFAETNMAEVLMVYILVMKSIVVNR